jgi:hypothetical protein
VAPDLPVQILRPKNSSGSPWMGSLYLIEKRINMEYEEAKAKIVEGLEKKSKSKTKFYFNDLSKILELKPREAKSW